MRVVAVDIESYDPNLHTDGDGSCRGDGEVLCVGTFDGYKAKCYIPNSTDWDEFKDILRDDDTIKVFHNGIYDLAWLCCNLGLETGGELHDTMTRMTYINEYAELGLDACCKYFNITGKNKNDTIEAWWEENRGDIIPILKEEGIPAKKNDDLWKHALFLWENFEVFRENMIKYNLQDCRATWNLYQAQEPKLKNVYDAYMIDVRLTPLIVKMKKTGVKVDVDAMHKLSDTVECDMLAAEQKLIDEYGIDGEIIASPKKLGLAMNELGIHSPVLTATGNESWSADAMSRISHPIIGMIEEYKNYSALLNKYLQGAMAHSIVGDRIHCTFSPNKREKGGTVTGRFACSHPNLQNIPARDKEFGVSYGQQMRALFLPEEGCVMGAMDYSQIEYLLLAHFAVGPQAEWFREQANAGVDFHKVAMQATEIPSRQVVKTFNYGVIYGMGWRTAMLKNFMLFSKLAAEHNKPIEAFTQDIFNTYHARLPVIRDTMNFVQNGAKMYGYVKTIGGRYQHKPKPQYDPATGKINDFIYKMLNKLIQGSAADILKFALLEAYQSGVFDVLTFHITVHDENVVSIPYNKRGTEAAKELKHIMDYSFHDKLKVPMKACAEVGPNWGYWSDDIWNDMQNGIFNKQHECWWG